MILIEDVLDYINDNTAVRIRLFSEHTSPYVETEYYSDLGEDVVETIFVSEETGDALLKALQESTFDYSELCDETMELYIKNRPRGTEDFTARQLVADADWKIAFWNNFVNDLNVHFGGK